MVRSLILFLIIVSWNNYILYMTISIANMCVLQSGFPVRPLDHIWPNISKGVLTCRLLIIFLLSDNVIVIYGWFSSKYIFDLLLLFIRRYGNKNRWRYSLLVTTIHVILFPKLNRYEGVAGVYCCAIIL